MTRGPHFLSNRRKYSSLDIPGCLQIVPDNGGGDLVVGRNHDGSGNSGFDIGTVASFLSSELKTGRKKHFFQSPPMNRCYLWHFQAPTAIECFSMATHEGLIHFPSFNS